METFTSPLPCSPLVLEETRKSADSPQGTVSHRSIHTVVPPRPAWVEIDLNRLRCNFELIHRDKPADLRILSVVKDEGYGHGALAVARAALEAGASFLALSTVEEAIV